jgi:hypothetical protein
MLLYSFNWGKTRFALSTRYQGTCCEVSPRNRLFTSYDGKTALMDAAFTPVHPRMFHLHVLRRFPRAFNPQLPASNPV